MNQETIENHIKNLGKTDFDAVASLVLTRLFGLTPIDVDGKGDGGSDYRLFSDSGSRQTAAIQKTVQQARWREKAVEDAGNAVSNLDAHRFFFLTSRAHEPTAIRAAENDITSTHGIPATCLGATEIAGMIVDNGLTGEFAHAIGLPLDVSLEHRPDAREIMLHSYFALSHDREDLRTSVYDATIQSVLHFATEPVGREEAVSLAMERLGVSEAKRQRISSRVESLLSRGSITLDRASGTLSLSPEQKESFRVADGIYLKEMQQLAGSQTDLIESKGGHWSAEQSGCASVFLSQMFVQQQLRNAKHSSLALAMTGFGSYSEDPETSLRTLVLESGVPKQAVAPVVAEFVDMAGDLPLVKKLTRAVVHIALETTDPNKSAAVIGAKRWSDVRVVLDASVAIPYMSSSLFSPTQGRFSRGSNECVSDMKTLSARLTIPWVYLNECASHLVRAVSYCRDMSQIEDSLAFSQNGFVSHYYQLKQMGRSAPDSLESFIASVSPKALVSGRTMQETVRAVMSDLQPLLRDYGVDYEDMPAFAEHYKKDVEVAYAHALDDLKRKKSQNLVDHDVKVLCHLRRCVSENGDLLMCLTWDGVMIRVGAEVPDCGWIVSPQEASDMVQPRLKLSQGKLVSLAHSVARALVKPDEIGARIVDRIVSLSKDRLDDWEYRERIRTFRDEAVGRIDASSPTYADAVDLEVETFLEKEGIPMPEGLRDTDESETE